MVRRGTRYHIRASIPVDIKDTYPKTEETKSLKTGDFAEAVKRYRTESALIDQRFEAHRKEVASKKRPALKELSDSQILHIRNVYYAFLLEEDEETREAGFFEENGPLPETPIPTFEEYAEDIEAWDEGARSDYARGKVEEFFIEEAEEVLSWDGIELHLEPGSPSWARIRRALQEAYIQANEAKRSRNQGNVVDTPKVAEATVKNVSTPLLSEAVQDWIHEKKIGDDWVEKTEREHRIWMAHFITINGDRPISDYQKADGRKFKTILMSLPSNWVKRPEINDYPVDKAAAEAKRLGLEPMSKTNVNKLIGFIAAFWNWADDNFDEAPGAIMKGLKFKLKKKAKDDRDPFTTEELRAIFNAPIFKGCRSENFWKQPGDLVLNNKGKYWVPLIGLYTGARLGEIVQLHTADISEEHGVLHFVLTDEEEDQRLKNSNSARRVPVHPDLVRMGFMKHVEKQRTKGEKRLFPECKMGADGYYSSPFSKFFNDRFLRSLNIKRRRNAFHSFRHSFEDAGRDSDVVKEIRDAMVGHGEEGMSARYGVGYYLEKTNEAMGRIHFRGLDLSHLFVD